MQKSSQIMPYRQSLRRIGLHGGVAVNIGAARILARHRSGAGVFCELGIGIQHEGQQRNNQ
jgi:hypothetical protein